MIAYRERIGWRSGGRLICCRAECTFIVLPGPIARWADATSIAGLDSVMLFPDPGTKDDADLVVRVGAIVESMTAVSAS
jgi:hypothetical protein